MSNKINSGCDMNIVMNGDEFRIKGDLSGLKTDVFTNIMQYPVFSQIIAPSHTRPLQSKHNAVI